MSAEELKFQKIPKKDKRIRFHFNIHRRKSNSIITIRKIKTFNQKYKNTVVGWSICTHNEIMTNTKTSEESLNNFQEQKESVQNSENNENDIIKSVENEDDNPLKDSHENILMSFIDMRKTIQSKTSAEQQLLMMIVGQMQKLEKDVQTERSERMRLEKEIKDRNVTDDEQLAHLTKTVDTLLYNLQRELIWR